MRRAEIRSDVPNADAVAAAIRPDNTPEMETRVVDGEIVTTIERENASGLRSTVDDYVVNLDVAMTVAAHANRSRTTTTNDTDTNTETETQ